MSLDKYLSADCHVVEPADLWVTRMDKEFRDRAPRVEARQKGGRILDYFIIDGLPAYPSSGFEGSMMEEKIEKGSIEKLMGHRYAETRKGAWDPIARLADQDLDHIEAEVLYPGIFGLQFSLVPDPEYQRECFCVYNDWLAEFCAAAPKRLIGAGFLPVKGPVEWTIQEAQRCAKIGLKSISIPQFVDERPYHRPEWEPFWRAAEELDLPISIHVGTGISLHGSFAQAEHVGRFFSNHMATCMGDLVWGAVLQNHPRLRFVGVECGIGWIAHQLNGWDRFWEDHKWIRPKLDEPPSCYFKRQFWATFERDRAGILTRELLNLDHLMWGSDYPHLEGTFPASAKMVARIFAGIPEDETRKMVRDNCARLYQLSEP